jgi:hypothetical protein
MEKKHSQARHNTKLFRAEPDLGRSRGPRPKGRHEPGSFDRAGVPDLSVSGDNSDLVEVDPHDPTTTSEPEAPMQSLNQLPMVTDLADARSA